MEELQIALCEDDRDETEHLIKLIRSGTVPVNISAFDSGEAFLKAHQPGRFDMVFMDIYMGGISGVETVRLLREREPGLPVAFVTSSQDHALDGYRLKVAKYLEKPVTQEDMDGAIALAVKWREQAAVEVVLQGKKLRLEPGRLLYAEQKAHYLLFYFEDGRLEQVKGRLDELEPQLAGYPFFRSHKSYLANLSHVADIDQGLLVFCMTNGQVVYIRRDLMKRAKDAWEDWLFTQARKGDWL